MGMGNVIQVTGLKIWISLGFYRAEAHQSPLFYNKLEYRGIVID
jgi:hypothetical protein